MDEGFIFSSSISIWNMDENETVRIGIGMSRNLSIVPIDGPSKMENYIMVLIEVVYEVVSSGSYFVQFQVLDTANQQWE
jgi:hypothetical protein